MPNILAHAKYFSARMLPTDTMTRKKNCKTRLFSTLGNIAARF